MYVHSLKRLLDLVLSIFGILVLSCPMLVIAVCIRLDSPGPILFRQRRVGRHKRYFTMYKFRSMRTETPHETPTHELEQPDRYITAVGAFLRRTSLDELPQLFNILRGDMSFIGPRPALWNQYDLIEERDRYGANALRPGLSGWAQVNGRDTLDVITKARFDGEYGQRISFLFDCRCFFRTVIGALRCDDVIEGAVDGRRETAKSESVNEKRTRHSCGTKNVEE